MLIPGKRYKWLTVIPGDKYRDGLFTGEYDKNNGNAILMTRNGETWSVPEKNCILVKKPQSKG